MNISAIKTPGVYINEIDAFPPSIAQVATAIPAFVGYTQKATSQNVPTRISSLLEYEQIFGGAPAPASITIDLDSNLLPTDNSSVTESEFKLYNSMRLFYANGGGECYIVSIGLYTDNPAFDAATKTKFTDGITTLEKYDEPTLILFPDAINLSAADLGAVQLHSLMQCSKLMDRFTIMDVKQSSPANLITDSEDFRDEVGNQNLKYGAAYYPYLQANYPYQFRFNDINGTAVGKVDFASIYATDLSIAPLLAAFDVTYKKVYQNIAPNDANNGYSVKWSEKSKDKVVIANDFSNTGDYVNKLLGFLEILGQTTTLVNPFKTYTQGLISVSLKQYAQRLFDFKAVYDGLQTADGADVDALPDDLADIVFTTDPNVAFEDLVWRNGNFAASLPTNPYTGALITGGLADKAKIQAALDKLHAQIIAAMNSTINALENYVSTEESNLTSNIPIYPAIISKLSQSMNTVPPSGAIAGIYAQTDATRGVWKAPANVSVNGIIGLMDDINDKDQENMNIHETGKSINAIRKFTGRGTLVWGARTLDGNSNDWRYVNVRRLANMIEEATKKACMQFVFEPNVAQTWINVKGMIENYLTTLWNNGALAGAKPEHAFFVAVGLNQTMSAQDILEGKMIVKIGYAPSRPAEFIILEFKQMQQKS